MTLKQGRLRASNACADATLVMSGTGTGDVVVGKE